MRGIIKTGLGSVKRRLSRSKSRPSGSQASSACGSTLSLTDPAVPPSSAEDVYTGATQNLTETPSASLAAIKAIDTRGSTSLAPTPTLPVAVTLEIPDLVEANSPLGQPGAQEPVPTRLQEPSERGCSERQLFVVPQIVVSGPDEDNGK